MSEVGFTFQLIGKVQGVGMRFYVSRLAKRHALKGYVKNQRDGSVLGDVIGDETEIENFFVSLERDSPGKITEIKKTTLSAFPSYKGFSVKFF